MQEAVQENERGQASLEFDLTLTDLEDRQQSTWCDPSKTSPTEESTTSPNNFPPCVNEGPKSRTSPQATSFSQQASTANPGIQGASRPQEAPDDYWVFRRIKLRPDGLEELQLGSQELSPGIFIVTTKTTFGRLMALAISTISGTSKVFLSRWLVRLRIVTMKHYIGLKIKANKLWLSRAQDRICMRHLRLELSYSSPLSEPEDRLA